MKPVLIPSQSSSGDADLGRQFNFLFPEVVQDIVQGEVQLKGPLKLKCSRIRKLFEVFNSPGGILPRYLTRGDFLVGD